MCANLFNILFLVISMGYYDEIAGSYEELHKDEQLSKIRIIAEHLDI